MKLELQALHLSVQTFSWSDITANWLFLVFGLMIGQNKTSDDITIMMGTFHFFSEVL